MHIFTTTIEDCINKRALRLNRLVFVKMIKNEPIEESSMKTQKKGLLHVILLSDKNLLSLLNSKYKSNHWINEIGSHIDS